MMNDNHKLCKACGALKALEFFSKDRSKADGMSTQCKHCKTAYKRENSAAISTQRKAYRLENADAISRYMISYRPEYRKANSEKLQLSSAKWANDNKERSKQIQSDSRKRNPDTGRSVVRNRRARIKGNGGTHSGTDVRLLKLIQRNKCACCRVDFGLNYHVDHIQPIASGGTNDKSNLQILCANCNLSKGAKDPIEFMQSRGFLI